MHIICQYAEKMILCMSMWIFMLCGIMGICQYPYMHKRQNASEWCHMNAIASQISGKSLCWTCSTGYQQRRYQKFFMGKSISRRWIRFTWWRHKMETFSEWLALCGGYLPVIDGSTHPPTLRIASDALIFFHLRLNKRLSKQSRCRSFETPSRSLWRHCYVQRINNTGNASMSWYGHDL